MLKVIDRNTQTDGIAVDLATTDDVLVMTGIRVENTHVDGEYQSAIVGLGNGHRVDLFGFAHANGTAISIGGSGASHDNIVHVGNSGYVVSDAFHGITMLGYDGVIRNEGSVYGAVHGLAWWSDVGGSRSYVYNSGHIEGGQDGIFVQLSEAVTVRNSGIVEGGSYAFSTTGIGMVRLINTGLLQGTVALGARDDVYDGRLGDVDGQIDGYGGNDRIWGGDNGEVIFAGSGKDRVDGGDGNDFVSGGTGADRLTGSEGLDNFYYLATNESLIKSPYRDLILDFTRADGDLINIDGVDANASTPNNDDFTFVGTAAFSGTAGEVRYDYIGNNTLVHLNTDSDPADEMVIELVGKIASRVPTFRSERTQFLCARG